MQAHDAQAPKESKERIRPQGRYYRRTRQANLLPGELRQSDPEAEGHREQQSAYSQAQNSEMPVRGRMRQRGFRLATYVSFEVATGKCPPKALQSKVNLDAKTLGLCSSFVILNRPARASLIPNGIVARLGFGKVGHHVCTPPLIDSSYYSTCSHVLKGYAEPCDTDEGDNCSFWTHSFLLTKPQGELPQSDLFKVNLKILARAWITGVFKACVNVGRKEHLTILEPDRSRSFGEHTDKRVLIVTAQTGMFARVASNS